MLECSLSLKKMHRSPPVNELMSMYPALKTFLTVWPLLTPHRHTEFYDLRIRYGSHLSILDSKPTNYLFAVIA